MSETLYTVKGYQGAFILHDVRDTAEFGRVADVQLIGAVLPFSVPEADISPFTMSAAIKEPTGDMLKNLAQEAATVYNLEPGRVMKAAELARQVSAIQQARRDERNEQIKPSLKVLIVRGRAGWYVVRTGSCTCPDSRRGNVCKHRIAAWMYREAIVRPMVQVSKKTRAVVLAELGAS